MCSSARLRCFVLAIQLLAFSVSSAGKVLDSTVELPAVTSTQQRVALSRQSTAMSQLLLHCAGRLLFTSEDDASLQEGLADLLQCTEVLCATQLGLHDAAATGAGE